MNDDGIVRIQQDGGQPPRLLIGSPDLSHIGKREDHAFDAIVQRPVKGDPPVPPTAVRSLHLLLLGRQGSEHLLDVLLERAVGEFGRDVADGPIEVRGNQVEKPRGGGRVPFDPELVVEKNDRHLGAVEQVGHVVVGRLQLLTLSWSWLLTVLNSSLSDCSSSLEVSSSSFADWSSSFIDMTSSFEALSSSLELSSSSMVLCKSSLVAFSSYSSCRTTDSSAAVSGGRGGGTVLIGILERDEQQPVRALRSLNRANGHDHGVVVAVAFHLGVGESDRAVLAHGFVDGRAELGAQPFAGHHHQVLGRFARRDSEVAIRGAEEVEDLVFTVDEHRRRRELVQEQAVRHLGETDGTGCARRRSSAARERADPPRPRSESRRVRAAPGRCVGKCAISWRPARTGRCAGQSSPTGPGTGSLPR